MLLYAVSGDDLGETSGAPIVGSDGCSSGSYLKQLFPRYLRYRDNSIASQIAIYTIRWLQTTIDTMISFVFRLDLSKVFSEQFDIMCAQNQKRWAQHFFFDAPSYQHR